MSDHFARPLATTASVGGFDLFVKPFVCSVCGQPIERRGRGGGAWRHLSAQDIAKREEMRDPRNVEAARRFLARQEKKP